MASVYPANTASLPGVSAPEPVLKCRERPAPGAQRDWTSGRMPLVREYFEVATVIGAVALAGWFVPFTYHTFGLIYLLVVIALSLRVGRWPALAAALLSAVTWNYVFIPPRLSFSVLEFDDGLLLGTYLVVALVAGQLTARIRAQERMERLRERRATALFQVARALAEAPDLDEAVEAALRQADQLFNATTAVSLIGRPADMLRTHRASSFALPDNERGAAEWAREHGAPAGRFTSVLPALQGLHVPMARAHKVFGVFSVRMPADTGELPPVQRELIEGFAAQIALLLEREELRAASEREKLFAESDRLHRTLLDSVSHELKTPLAVLRSAGEKIDGADPQKQASLASEMRTATRRLDHLVANLLNQNRLESGALRPQPDWCDVRDLVQAARREAGEALAAHPFRVAIPEDLPLVMADAPLMEQALGNLLRNAALYTPAGSPVLVSAGRELRDGRDWIYLRVDDRGTGLPPELRNGGFQKFRRGEGARAGGLGLGLSIVHGFMLAQGGLVEAGDNPAGGARFTVYLPHITHGAVPNDDC